MNRTYGKQNETYKKDVMDEKRWRNNPPFNIR